MKIFKFGIAPVLSALLLASCAGGADPSTGGGVEAVCIISGEDATGGPTAEFMGQTVSFCCKRCKARWDKMDESARKASLADYNQ